MTDDKKLKVTLTEAERDLFLNNQLVDKEYFKAAEAKEGNIEIDLSYEQVEDLMGFIAAEAGYSEDEAYDAECDRIYEKLENYLEQF